MTGSVNQCYAKAMDVHEERFHGLLAVFAAQCNTELNELTIEIYDRHLARHGYPAVCKALESLLVEREDKSPFPSVATILGRMGLHTSPKTLAMDVTNRIASAISSKGNNWSDKVQDFEADMLRVLGEAGVAVVKRLGGWAGVVEFANGNPNYYRTWIRDSAIAVIEREGPRLLALPQSAVPSRIEQKK